MAVAFLPTTLRDSWVSCSNFMKENKLHMPFIGENEDHKYVLAFDANQIDEEKQTLFSEDLY